MGSPFQRTLSWRQHDLILGGKPDSLSPFGGVSSTTDLTQSFLLNVSGCSIPTERSVFLGTTSLYFLLWTVLFLHVLSNTILTSQRKNLSPFSTSLFSSSLYILLLPFGVHVSKLIERKDPYPWNEFIKLMSSLDRYKRKFYVVRPHHQEVGIGRSLSEPPTQFVKVYVGLSPSRVL